jgi:hypothetical protein
MEMCDELGIDPENVSRHHCMSEYLADRKDVELFCLAADLGSKATGEWEKGPFVAGWSAMPGKWADPFNHGVSWLTTKYRLDRGNEKQASAVEETVVFRLGLLQESVLAYLRPGQTARITYSGFGDRSVARASPSPWRR